MKEFESELKSNKYTIHVPQGRTARLMKDSLLFDIEALHTEGFTTCNILVCIGKDRITLTHADMITDQRIIKDQIEWVGESSDLIIIHRKDGTFVTNNLLDYFKKTLAQKKLILKTVDEPYDGVMVSFSLEEKNEIHPQIKLFPLEERPACLLRHPQEQKFLAVHKIEQIIGTLAECKTGKTRPKQQLIFDGLAWEPINENELKIDDSDPDTREEMDFFDPNDPYIKLSNKLSGIIIRNKEKGINLFGDQKIIAMKNAFYLEGYLNNFDAELLFKRDTSELINYVKYVPISDEDKKFKSGMLNLLKNKKANFNKIFPIVDEFKTQAPETAFKKKILPNHNEFVTHYHNRMCYRKIENDNQRRLESAKVKTSYAAKHYQNREYTPAVNLFFEALKEATLCCLKTAPELANAYYNYGRSLYQEDKYEKAKFFLEHAVTLSKDYAKCLESDIKKAEKALQECNSKLMVSDNNDLPSKIILNR